MPYEYDAWEIKEYYKDRMTVADNAESVEPYNKGGLVGFVVKRKFRNSEMEQTIVLHPDRARLDFSTRVDWREEHLLLKAAFPLDILASEAAYDVQFGTIRRPTHANTSWDAAKFEVCAHKFSDVSNGGYGVSLLNDCRYGHSADGSELSISLLKGATYPSDSDKGIHEFTYSLFLHEGVFGEETIREAYALNRRPYAVSFEKKNADERISSSGLVSVQGEGVVAETVKKAERRKLLNA